MPAGLTGVQAIAAGDSHTVALKSDGTVIAWGSNFSGQTNVPVGLTGVQAIAAGVGHTVALKSGGTIVAWGDNQSGKSTPPTGLVGVKAIAAGYGHTVALKSDGTVVAWGDYSSGQTNVPAGLTGVQAIAAGDSHTVALKSDGTVVAWGSNIYVQTNVPVGLTGVQAIAAGYGHTVALKSNGTVVAWGYNSSGQTSVPGELTGVQAIAAGGYDTMALMAPKVAFGVQSVGTTSAAKTFTLKNTGSAPLSITSVSVTGGNSSDFSVNTTGMLTTVPAINGQTNFTLTFNPSASGVRTTTLRVVSNDADESPFDIQLTSPVPEIAVTGIVSYLFDDGDYPDYDFGTSTQGYITDGDTIDLGSLGLNVLHPLQPFVYTIRNESSDPMSGVSVTLTGTNANQFKLIKAPDATVPPQGSTTFTVQARITSLGVKTANIRIASNDADENPFDITLNATGVAASLPTAVTGTATSLFVKDGVNDVVNATVHSSVDANSVPRVVFFEYGVTNAYGDFNVFNNNFTTVSSKEPQSVSATLANLLPHTTYHYRVRAESGSGRAIGADKTFLTPNHAPIGEYDVVSVTPLASVSLDVLSNDTDADNDKLFIVGKAAVIPASAGTVTIKGNRLVFTASATFDTGDYDYAVIGYTLSDTFAGGTATAGVEIYSSTCSLTPMTKNLSSEGVNYPIEITAYETAWSVTEALSWVTVSPTQGIVEATVQVNVLPNTSSNSRTGIIKIGGVNHMITQAGVVAPLVSAAVITGTATTGPFNTVVGARGFSVSVPCTNLPATFSVASGTLPPGLTLNATTGVISGIPTVGGSADVPTKAYPLTIKATNLKGSSTTPSFIINVDALPANVVGLYHGYVTPSPTAHMTADSHLGGRFEMSTMSTGAVTGQIYEGATKKSFVGTLTTTLATKQNPTLTTATTGTDYTLSLTLDATTNTLSGTLHNSASSTPVNAWRNAWRSAAPANKATHFIGQNNFFMRNTDPLNGPQGYGYASFSVHEATGALTIIGKLADETKTTATTITTSFIGQQGQVLFYLPLYNSRGSCSGVLTCDPAISGDNQTQGTLTWIKPPSPAAAKDTVYKYGFGPLFVEARGNRYDPPAPGQRVMSAPATTTNNATFSYRNGGLSADFTQALLIKNPSPTGLTNTATLPAFKAVINAEPTPNPNPNKVTMPALNAASGLFSGSFTPPGTPARVAPYYGLIVRDVTPTTDTVQGYGYFILPSIPGIGQSATTAPKQSGSATLTAP